MRHLKHSFLLITVQILFFLTGCGAVNLDFSGAEGGLAVNRRTPESVVVDFFSAWESNDLEAMYGSISQRSREMYPFETFQRFYQQVGTAVGISGLEVTINEVTEQGLSVAIQYDLLIESTIFDNIQDEKRTIRLVQEGDVWRVAWSTMDIFEGYTTEARIAVETENSRRENIYDRNGQPLVIENGSVSVLYGQQSLMSDVAACQDLLANLLYQPINDIRELFLGYLPETVFYVGEIDDYIEVEYGAQLRDLCGMSAENNTILRRTTRQYIGQGAAVHVTGYIGPIPQEPESEKNRWLARGYSENDLIGRAGVELQYEAQLAGRPPRVLRLTEPGGTVLKELGRVEGTPPQSVYLTIDRELQIEAARAVAWGYNYASNNWGAPGISPGAGLVVMDVQTGAILALVSYPTFQPGLFNPDSFASDRGQLLADIVNNPRNPLTNRVTQEQYSPGSVFKIVTTAAVINEGLISPNDSFFCDLRWDGRDRFGDTFSPRSDWRLTDGMEAAGNINPVLALTSSCDPFFYEFGARLFLERQPNTLVNYAREMGLGGQTGVGVFREVNGNLPVPQSVEEAINNAIGQGDTQVTLLQTARMVAAVANGGTVFQPYVVQQIGNGAAAEIVGNPTPDNILDYLPEAIVAVEQGMCEVPINFDLGTAYGVFVGNEVPNTYTVCGKTGTAQAGYAPNAWFVAYAPAENPEIAVVAMAQNSREGSEVAAPMVRRVLDVYFNQERAPFPEWWEGEYVPLQVPEGGVAGG